MVMASTQRHQHRDFIFALPDWELLAYESIEFMSGLSKPTSNGNSCTYTPHGCFPVGLVLLIGGGQSYLVA